jgi:pyruvate carboxylase subunit B
MKREFTLKFEGVDYPIVAEGDTISVNGRPFTVEVAKDGAVLVDGIAYDVSLEDEAATVDGESYAVEFGGLAAAPVAPPAALPAVASAPVSVEASGGAVKAIMPGKIIRILIEPGQQVEEGEPVCVLEAMKMENELNALCSGTVRAIHVGSGDDVEKDQILIEIE